MQKNLNARTGRPNCRFTAVCRSLSSFLCVAACLCSGCGVTGQGTLTREELPVKFRTPVSPEKLAQLRADAEEERPFFLWRALMTAKPGRKGWVVRTTDPRDGTECYIEKCRWDGGFWLTSLFFTRAAWTTYKADPPQIEWYEESRGVLCYLLYRHADYLYPCPSDTDTTATAGYRYQATNNWLTGLFGWGRLNHQRYVRIQWVSFPTGRVREEPRVLAPPRPW